MSIHLLLIAAACVAVSGVPGLLLGRRGGIGQWIATLINVIALVIGGMGLLIHFTATQPSLPFTWAWSLPFGKCSVAIDDLGALFLIPVLLISALGSIYGLEYWKQSRHPTDGRKLRFWWGVLAAGMMLVVLARDGVFFLIAWEIMALAAFFLIATQDKKLEVRRAAWVYLVATHCGAMCLLAMFALLRFASGSFDLWPQAAGNLPPWIAAAIFITGVVGFGLKAGIMPLHVWLPGAHASAPSHVSAIMSGVLLNMGLYGIIRMASFMAHPPLWWGATLLVAGTVSGVVGIVFAVVQHDFKRLLAYSSIENIGIMTIGVGLALIGRSLDRFDLIVLGMGGALFHLLNHSLFKPLLFMGAGSILHGTRMRQIDLLGGLARRMPGTFVWVIIGAVAICALPPLNGFIGELLIYMGLFRTASPGLGRTLLWVSLAAPALAVIGALAVAAFVKLIGVAFGGSPRTRAAARAHDPGKRMLGPMAILAICCIVIGVAPILVTPAIDRGVAAWDSLPGQMGISIRSLVPLNCISGVAFALIAVVLSGALMLRWLRQRRPMATAGTWDCGYALPGPTMQYTGSSFTQTLGSLFSWVLIPRRAIVRVVGLFPRRERFRSDTPDTVLDRALLPLFWAIERVLSWARPIQRGSVQVYLLYMLSILLILLMLAGWTR